MFLNLLLPYNLLFGLEAVQLKVLFIIVVTCSNTLLISSCCSYYQLQLCVGLRGMVFGEVKQSTIYAKFGESSCKKAFKKQKIIPCLTEHDDVINMLSLPSPGGGIFF